MLPHHQLHGGEDHSDGMIMREMYSVSDSFSTMYSACEMLLTRGVGGQQPRRGELISKLKIATLFLECDLKAILGWLLGDCHIVWLWLIVMVRS